MPPLAPRIWAVETIDHAAVAEIVTGAFDRPDEALLVEKLREENAVLGEWIATREQMPLGYILASRGGLIDNPDVAVACLAPLAVLPSEQGKGLGAALVRYAISELAVEAIDLMFVLGEPEYYCRFGFSSDFGRAFDTPWREAGDANMVMALSEAGTRIGGGALSFAAPLVEMS